MGSGDETRGIPRDHGHSISTFLISCFSSIVSINLVSELTLIHKYLGKSYLFLILKKKKIYETIVP